MSRVTNLLYYAANGGWQSGEQQASITLSNHNHMVYVIIMFFYLPVLDSTYTKREPTDG